MTRARLAVLAAVVAAVTAVPAPASAALPPDEAVSTNIQALVNELGTNPFYLNPAAAAGWKGARGDAFWFQVQPSNASTFDWSATDAIKQKLDAAGMRWQPILVGTPSWAGPNRFGPPNPASYDAFARFAGEFAARYGPSGAMRGNLPVTDVEISNEMNVLGPWQATSAASYADLFRRAAGPVHANGVRATVGALLYDTTGYTDAEYIRDLFAALGPGVADAIGIHPYAPTPIGVFANFLRMKRALQVAGQGDLPIYVNELGYPAAIYGNAPKARAIEGATTDEARAGTVSLITDGLLDSNCAVQNIAYFDLVNTESATDEEKQKGLLRTGTGALTGTGVAYRDSGVRFRANPNPARIDLCSAQQAAGTPLLPLDVEVARPAADCYRPTVRYRGFPIEEATVTYKGSNGKTATQLTVADGRPPADFCGEAGLTYTIQAEVSYAPANVPRVALSPALTCQGGTCSTTTPGPPTPTAKTLSAQASCLLRKLKIYGSRRVRTVLKKGLRYRATGCAGLNASASLRRTLSLTATIDTATAKRLKVTKKRAKKPVKVASGSKSVTRSSSVTVTLKFTKTARKRLARSKRLKLTVALAVRQSGLRGTATRKITLTR